MTSACEHFFSCVCALQNNELPADLTKSDRILNVLRPKILNGDSWWPSHRPPAFMSVCTLLMMYIAEQKKTQCQIYSSTICTVHGACFWLRLKRSCHMLNKTWTYSRAAQSANHSPSICHVHHLRYSVVPQYMHLFLFTPGVVRFLYILHTFYLPF